MSSNRKKRSRKAGLPPGTPVHIGEPKSEKAQLGLIAYGEGGVEERSISSASELAAVIGKSAVTWVNLDGVHDVKLIEEVGNLFSLHPLVLEDLANTDQRPKFEDYESYAFIVLKMLTYNTAQHTVETEQIGLVLGGNYVLSFGERPGDVFNGVRDRIRTGRGKIRRMGPDYLTYALLDAVVDHYFIILENLGDQIEDLEERLLSKAAQMQIREVYRLKRELLALRRAVWPLREALSALERRETNLIKPETAIFVRDVYDHTVQVIDTLENYRDVMTGMLDVYLSSVSYRTNVVMRVLTVIATIFMPLTFLAGVWGMNFKFMPELAQPWAYPAALLFMFGLGAWMFFYFRRKGWM